MKNLLTIAGSDSSGGAGIQADIKTFCAHKTYAMSVITAVTAQNTLGVFAVQDIAPEIIKAQIDAVFSDITVDAVKIGMLSNPETIKVVAERLIEYKPQIIVLDPVMVSKSGYELLKSRAVETLIKDLIPIATIVTPNIPEAQIISDMKIQTEEDIKNALCKIQSLGCKNVLIKGGHFEGAPTDYLFDGKTVTTFKSERLNIKNTHGTGCSLSSAIAANLALGYGMNKAIENAKAYVFTGIKNSFSLGHGVGPINHFYEIYKNKGEN